MWAMNGMMMKSREIRAECRTTKPHSIAISTVKIRRNATHLFDCIYHTAASGFGILTVALQPTRREAHGDRLDFAFLDIAQSCAEPYGHMSSKACGLLEKLLASRIIEQAP